MQPQESNSTKVYPDTYTLGFTAEILSYPPSSRAQELEKGSYTNRGSEDTNMFALKPFNLCVLLTLLVRLGGAKILVEDPAVRTDLLEIEADPQLLTCGNFTPSFCDMVGWQVPSARLVATDNQEMIIQMSYFNQPGTWDCKREYKEMQCRINFPKCTKENPVKPPCRSDCEEFAKRCPGSDVSCQDLVVGDKGCYRFKYATDIAEKTAKITAGQVLPGWVYILLTFLVMFFFSGVAYVVQKKQIVFENEKAA
mgnify:FL=1|jgi:hypothetical protein